MSGKSPAVGVKDKSTCWGAKYILAEVIMGYAFWTLLNEFVPTLWFFPLNRMNFTGMEAYISFFMIPIVLGSQYVRAFVINHTASIQVIAYSLGLLSFYAYDLNNPPFPFTLFPPDDPNAGRLPVVALTASVGLVVVFRLWWSSNTERRYRSLWGSLLGLLATIIIRLEFLTLNPITIWAKPIFAGIAAVVWAGFVLGTEKWPAEESHRTATPASTHSNSFYAGASLGGQMFLTHMMYNSHGTVSRHIDLNPYPSGLVVIVAVIIGILIAGKIHRVSPKKWFVIGGLGGLGLFILGEDGLGGPFSYVGLFGGALLGVYTISVWPAVVQNFANTRRPGFALFIQSFLYISYVFWSVWTVAYKFVPWWTGALMLRERNRTLLLALLLSANIYLLGDAESRGEKLKDEANKKDKKQQRRIPASVIDRAPRKEIIVALVAIVVLLVPVTIHRTMRMPSDIKPSNADTKPTQINGMIWNIHFGFDNFGRNNFEDVAVAIKERNINVVGLLETDMNRIINGNRDFMEFLEVELNMYSDFGPSTAKSTWGCGLLSAFPIESAEHVILPSPEGELACLIDAVILVDGAPVNVLVTHFGNTEDQLDRQLQTEAMADLVKKQSLPMVVLSYITARPYSPNYMQLVNSGLVDTAPQANRYCQYIFYKNLKLLSFERWNGGTLSDTEAQYATWILEDK